VPSAARAIEFVTAGAFVMSRRSKVKDIDTLIDRGAARLENLPESALAERVQMLAATTGRWRVNRVNDTWVLLDEDGLIEFEDSSLGTVAFLLGMYADLKERPEMVIERYSGDLLDRQEIGNGTNVRP
jgi:hypothetical protein